MNRKIKKKLSNYFSLSIKNNSILFAMRIAIAGKVGASDNLTVNVYDHVYNYINTMDVNNWSGEVSEERKKNKIRRIYIYCHGLVFRLAMGITNRFTKDGDLDITTNNIHKIKEEYLIMRSKEEDSYQKYFSNL